MPNATASIADISLYSDWTSYTWAPQPSTDTETVAFDLSAIPENSIINSATLTGKVRTQKNAGYFTMESNGQTWESGRVAQNAGAVSFSVNAASWFSGGKKSGNLSVDFGYTAVGFGQGQGYNYEYGYFEDVSLAITYTLPYSSCSAPTSVTAASTNVAPGATVRISWSGAKPGTGNPITGYYVYRSTDQSTWTKLNSTKTSNTYYDVTAPTTNGATYYYAVVTVGTVSGYDSSRSSATASVKCSFSAPSVSAVKIDSSTSAVYKAAGASATLRWTGTNGTNNAISKYEVYQGTTKLGETTSKSYIVTAPAAGSSLTFYVLPVGAYSNGSKVASPTLYAYSSPSAPAAVSVGSNNVAPGASVTLSWSGAKAGTYNAIAGYRIMRATSATGTYSQVGSDISSTATSGSTTVTSHAANGSSYYYKVITIGARSNSAQSSVYAALTTTWTAPSVSAVKLDNSTSAQYRAAGASLTLTWSGTAGTNNAISKYEVYRNGTKLGETTAQTYTVTAHATAGSSYDFQVKAIGALSDSSLSASITVYTYSAPSAPTTVSASDATPDAGSSVTLSWSGAEDGEYNAITGYRVFCATSASGTYTQLGSDVTGTSVSVTAPSAMGSKYYYKVMALGTYSNSSQSSVYATVTAKTYTVPTPPSSVTVDNAVPDAGATTTLRWSGASAGTNNPITGYRVLRATSQNGTYAKLGDDLASTVSSLTITAPSTMGGSYWYKVVALGTKTGFILSDESSPVQVTAQTYTRCTAPTSVSISAALANPDSTVTLSWSGASGGTNNPIAGYKVYQSTGGSYTLLQSVDADVSSLAITVGASGTLHSLKVIAVGTKSGFDSYDSAIVSVKSNTPPAKITSFTTPGLIYESGTLRVSWSAPNDPDGNIASYKVQRRIQSSSWGSWTNLTTTTNLYFEDSPTTVQRGKKFQYRVCAVDALNLSGEYSETAEFTRNSAPLAPTITHPASGAVTYDTKPRLVVSCPADPDNHALSVMLSVDNGDYVNVGSVTGGQARTVSVACPLALSAGAHTLSVLLRDSLGADSTSVSVSVTVTAPGWGRTIQRGTIIANASTSHQAEIQQLYQMTNNVLAYYGLSAISIPALVGSAYSGAEAGKIGMFAAWGEQMLALQTALLSAYAVLGITAPAFTTASAGMAPTAAVINELRTAICAL